MTLEQALKLQRRPPKYGNKITERDGHKFASKGEADRWSDLVLLQKAGEIRNLKRQVKHALMINGVVSKQTYKSDFEYEARYAIHRVYPSPKAAMVYNWEEVIEDFKGAKTPLFELKWEIMKTMPEHYGKKFLITKKSSNRKRYGTKKTRT